ncbi:MAG TPA: TetR/AcrR family transcriptional regulator [Caldilineaceae bacterium]|nr:TetR/AcrR family transcriptional regulator [Caldilineaceae bacterium]
MEATSVLAPVPAESGPDDEHVLDLAAKLLAEEGAGLTMDRLATAAGLSRATLYRRFGSRSALIRRLIQERGVSAGDLLTPDVRTRVLQAARAVFVRYGFAAATVEQIAQEAGVGPVTIYRHFGSKEGLVAAFVQASSPRRLLRELAERPSGTLEENLIAFATTALRFIHDNRDLLQLAMQDSASGGALRDQFTGAQGRTAAALARYLAQQMEAGRLRRADPVDLAFAFVGMLFGHAFIGPHFYDRPLGDIPAVARLATCLFLSGCALPQEPAP